MGPGGIFKGHFLSAALRQIRPEEAEAPQLGGLARKLIQSYLVPKTTDTIQRLCHTSGLRFWLSGSPDSTAPPVEKASG